MAWQRRRKNADGPERRTVSAREGESEHERQRDTRNGKKEEEDIRNEIHKLFVHMLESDFKRIS